MPGHVHRYLPATDPSRTPLVLLHGTYGTETDLLPSAGEVAPGAARLSVRGTVAMDTGYAFFRRHPDRRVDEADLAARIPELAHLITRRLTEPPIALGFSNGAIMAAALLATRPGLLSSAILLRPLSPFADLPHPLEGVPVLLIDGTEDTRRAPDDGPRLAEQLRRAGASVTHRRLRTGHLPTPGDIVLAREWLEDRGL
ncbi:hypothetical protein P0W64_14455 [Tsukamurella sp. 8F]|uniref:alpha/beta hydrolase n=1 Tax=unclassified Tsukamurella TaxID=2633480 RepID=UPI0023B9699D|nr:MULTISPECIES: hypothetical protein [unclassified Tsukamurella]MDF0532167.1 hypothetical protein [Tsukamurella sp. 8J]MDF0587978.1 hypothetical protein [Tsukamurella sp. 8F]